MKKIILIMIIAAAAFASCEKSDYAEPLIKNVPKINMITGEAFIIYSKVKVKISTTKKAIWDPFRLPKSYEVQCIDQCSYTVNGVFYDQSAKFFINE